MSADNSFTKSNGLPMLTGETFTARISSSKAVVYADENMLSPLGYIANGKAIKVGNPRRINKDLVPLIVSGRLAFIEIKDIRYENSSEEEYKFKKGAPLEHNFDINFDRAEDHLSQNNSFYLGLHRYTAGSDVQNLFMNAADSNQDSFIGFEGSFIHRTPDHLFWGLGIDYSVASSNGFNFNYWMFSPSFGFTPIRQKLFNVDLYGTLDLALAVSMSMTGSDVEEPKGFIWGPQLNARMVFFPQEKYHAFAGLGIRKYFLSGYEELHLESIAGINAFLGLAIEFR
jgi:hypothetical protein